MAKTTKNVESATAEDTTVVAAEENTSEESATRVGPMHEAFAAFLNTNYEAGITAEQIFLVTSKRKAFRATPEYREGVKGALEAAKAQEAEAKAAKAAEREQAKAAREAEKEAKAAERAAAVADEQAERDAAHAAGPVAQKKERGRSENLDPEIEA